MQSVKRLEPDGSESTVSSGVIQDEVLRGGIFVVPECSISAGHFASLVKLSHAGIGEVATPAQAAAVRARGFEMIHEILSPAELMSVADRIQRRLEGVMPAVARALVTQVLGHEQDFFYEQHPNVRFH